MKQFIFLVATFFAFQAQAFFYCVTTDTTELGNPDFSITVYEPTQDHPQTMISLAIGDAWNVPQAFYCESAKLENDGVEHEEFQCEGNSAILSVYTAKNKQAFKANMSSEELDLEIEDMDCYEE